MRILILLCALFLFACTPNKAAQVTVDSVLVLSGEVDLAEKRGWITNAEEDELQNKLIAVLRIMGDASLAVSEAGCTESQSRQECIQKVLLDIEFKLREAQP